MSKKFKAFFYFFLVVAMAVLVVTSPLFQITEVVVSGTRRISRNTVLEKIGLDDTTNVLTFNILAARRELLKNQYIEDAVFKVDYLNKTISIEIYERTLSGYVHYKNDSYLYIDQHGRVLEVATYGTEKLPIVVGLDFSDFAVGNILDVTNPNSFHNIVTLANLFSKYDMESDFIKVDVSKDNDIRLFTNSLDVSFGGIEDADAKISTLKVIMEDLNSKNLKGFLDIRDINRSYHFRMLT